MPFKMEIGHFRWMATHAAKYNLSSSAVKPFELDDLEEDEDVLSILEEMYGVKKDEVTLAHGTQEANMLAFASLRKEVEGAYGLLPEYEPIRVLPEAFGMSWQPVTSVHDIPPRSLLMISNPNNPTGKFLDGARLEELSEELTQKGSYAIIDSIFSEFVNLKPSLPLSNVVFTSSTSKFFTMKGVKLGWLVGERQLVKEAAGYADLLSPGPYEIELKYASTILKKREAVRDRNASIVGPNGQLLESMGIDYVKGMPIAFIGADCNLDSVDLAELLLKRDVMTIPGKFFGVGRGVRVGLGTATPKEFSEATSLTSDLLRECGSGRAISSRKTSWQRRGFFPFFTRLNR